MPTLSVRPLLAIVILGATAAAAPNGGMPAIDVEARHVVPSASVDAAVVDLGALAVTLEQTTLSDVARALGGRISRSGDAGGSLRTLCYRLDDGSALWLASTEMGGPDGGVMVVALAAPRLTERSCAAPVRPIGLKLSAPGLGATTADLAKFYGHHPFADGATAFERDTPLPGAGTRSERVSYGFRDGRVDRLVLSRLTTY